MGEDKKKKKKKKREPNVTWGGGEVATKAKDRDYEYEENEADFRYGFNPDATMAYWEQFENKATGAAFDHKNEELRKLYTHYFRGDDARRLEVTVKDGKLVDAEGRPVDTTGASGIGTYNETGKGRHIYATSADGTMRTVDPFAARVYRESGASGETWDVALPENRGKEHVKHHGYWRTLDWMRAQGESWKSEDVVVDGAPKSVPAPKPGERKGYDLGLVNHSSLVAGEDVAAAGEKVIEDGELKLVSDQSGHYKPDNKMLYQDVASLEDQGVGMEGVTVEMVDKEKDGLDLANSADYHEGKLQAGALEFLSYGGARDAETQMRDARQARVPLMVGIEGFDRSKLRRVGAKEKQASDGAAGERELSIAERVSMLAERQRGPIGRKTPAVKDSGETVAERIARLQKLGLS